jgi:hypothetical protein
VLREGSEPLLRPFGRLRECAESTLAPGFFLQSGVSGG